jgi:hypothetical protein
VESTSTIVTGDNCVSYGKHTKILEAGDPGFSQNKKKSVGRTMIFTAGFTGLQYSQ